MAFDPEPNQIQTRVADISYQIFDPDPLDSEQRAAEFSAQILDQDGNVMKIRSGDMIQHMLPDEIATMQSLLVAWRARAEAGLIP